MKVADLDLDFEKLLEDAEKNIQSRWEKNFHFGVQQNFRAFGGLCHVTQKQLEVLRDMAKWPKEK